MDEASKKISVGGIEERANTVEAAASLGLLAKLANPKNKWAEERRSKISESDFDAYFAGTPI